MRNGWLFKVAEASLELTSFLSKTLPHILNVWPVPSHLQHVSLGPTKLYLDPFLKIFMFVH